MTKAEELAEKLIGTCDNCIPEEELDTKEQVEEFDSLAFNCDCCGWWCSTDELHNTTAQNLCDECDEQENGDGDYS